MIKKSFIYSVLFICLAFSAQSQSLQVADTSLRQYESILKDLSNKIFSARTNEERNEANSLFLKIFRDALHKDPFYSFDSLKFVSRVMPEDGSLKIFTWSLPAVDGNSYKFYGFIQLRNRKKFIWFGRRIPGKLIELKDRSEEIQDAENTPKLTPEKWYGAYYYKVLVNSFHGKKYYTLLGWKGNNLRSMKKVLDNFAVNGEKVVFGYPIFRSDRLAKSRIVFEFNSRVAMLLHYEEGVMVADLDKKVLKKGEKKKLVREDLIVFDHLAPGSSNLEGQYEYYGPDLSYDAYKFIKGKWAFYGTVDVRNEDRKVNDEKNRIVKSKKTKAGEDEFYRKYK